MHARQACHQRRQQERQRDERVRHRPRRPVDRTFLYRHADLLAQVHVAQATPAAAENGGPLVSRASLQADLAGAQAQVARQAAQIRRLEGKLSQMLGEQAWRESGLGAPEDIDRLRRRITDLEQTAVDLTRQLEERGEELDAARAANRDLIAQLNTAPRRLRTCQARGGLSEDHSGAASRSMR